ncbi:MAG: glycine cleavage system protein H [Desulfosarcinaceae bacterium]
MKEKTRSRSTRPIVFGQTNNQCVWSRAGVVKPMLCINTFDCLGCSFDRKVQADFEACVRESSPAVDDPRTVRLRMLINQRKCRHMLSGRVDYKLCGHGYDCARCPYDQMIEDTGLMPALTPANCENISGFNLARDYYYHPAHAWARVEYGGRIRIGLDDFASRLLGPQDEIKLPRLGSTVRQGAPQAVLRRGAHEAEVLSPVDGTVLAVNPKISGSARLANQAPYADGWLMVIQPGGMRKNLKNLLFGDESAAWMDDESMRLTGLLSHETGYRLAATGGEAVHDIYGSVPAVGWDRLVNEFLR